MSQKDLAERMRDTYGWRWSQATVWSVEKGERPLRFLEATDIVDIFEVPIEDLYVYNRSPMKDLQSLVRSYERLRTNLYPPLHDFLGAANSLSVFLLRNPELASKVPYYVEVSGPAEADTFLEWLRDHTAEDANADLKMAREPILVDSAETADKLADVVRAFARYIIVDRSEYESAKETASGLNREVESRREERGDRE